jgi:hypothetical protein
VFSLEQEALRTSELSCTSFASGDVYPQFNTRLEFEMKLNLRAAVWGLATAFAVATLATPAQAFAQSEQGMEHGRGHDKDKRNGNENDDHQANANNRFYNQGLNQGQYDREHNHGRKYRTTPRDDNDRQAYRAGYDQGYNSYNGQNDPYPRNGQYGQYGQNRADQYDNPGFRAGSQFGSTDGHNDRVAGRAWKYGSGYTHSDRGYNSRFGDKNAYRQQYQLGYQQGYQQAYGNRGYRTNR